MISDGLNKGSVDRIAIKTILEKNMWQKIGDTPCTITAFVDCFSRDSGHVSSLVSSTNDQQEQITRQEPNCVVLTFDHNGVSEGISTLVWNSDLANRETWVMMQ